MAEPRTSSVANVVNEEVVDDELTPPLVNQSLETAIRRGGGEGSRRSLETAEKATPKGDLFVGTVGDLLTALQSRGDCSKPPMVRLLRSYCNRARQTAHLEKLEAQANSQDIHRPEAPARVARAPKQLSPEINAAIVADYQAGMKATHIARKHGINEWTVRHRLRRSGIPLRPTSMNDEEVALTFALRSEGFSYERIGDRVGFSEGTVRNVLKRGR